MAAILIVDDDPTIHAIATEFLRDGDHAVIETSDGHEALSVLRATPIDLIVVDMIMPGKDGLETIMEARQIRPQARILAISSGGSMDVRQLLATARVLGADEVLHKPLTAGAFVGAVERLLAVAEDDSTGRERVN